MLKAYPRVWVDLTTTEVVSVLGRLFKPAMAGGSSLLPEFERAFAQFIGTKDAISFANCRSALYFSLKALDLEEGSEVILPAFTFWVDAAVIVLAGLKPVFVDVEFETLNIDVSKIEAAVTPKTRVVMLAHLNGLPGDMVTIMGIARRHNLRVIEDCARACGATIQGHRVGSFDIGAFSFGYGKSFYGFGGGMVTSDDPFFMRRLRDIKCDFNTVSGRDLIRAVMKGCLLKFLNEPWIHGYTLFPFVQRYQIKGDERFASWFRIKKPHYREVPETFKLKMFDLQARMGFRQLKTIDLTNRKRRNHLKQFNRELTGISGLGIPPDPPEREHVCVHYAIWTNRKKELQNFLMRQRIDAQDESAQDVTRMSRFKPFASGDFGNARKLNDRIIYLPCHPCLNAVDIGYIARKVREFFNV